MSPEGWRQFLAERLVWKDRTGSTNDDARELALGGAPAGTVVVAEEQTAGRGRKGAQWFCAPGEGLAFSVVLVPQWPREQWAWTALGAGVAVCEALEQVGLEPEIKWPNDVLLEGRKVCGILVESPGARVVAGIGLNVNGGSFPEGVAAVSMEQMAGRSFQREGILEAVWRALLEVSGRQVEEISAAVWERLAWREEEVEILPEGRRGRIVGLGVHGELRVECGSGEELLTDAGSLRRAAPSSR